MHISAEIPLLIFTLVAQLAVGIMIAGRFALAENVDEKTQGRINSQSYFALIFICIGALLSLLHLGTPSHAIFTVTNIGSSWISREIVMVLIVTVAIAAAALSVWKKASEKAAQALAIVASALGIALLYVMSQVYNSPFLPGWEGNTTFFLFLASALILGSFWIACVLGVAAARSEQTCNGPFWRLFFCALTWFGLVAAFVPMSVPEPVAGINTASITYSPESIAICQGVHAALCGIGVLFLGFGLWRILRRQYAGGFMTAALLLGLCGEIAGRCAFYMSYVKLGM